MKLKRLEIFGFKSFPQRTEIAFDQGITGIVGPNGSGKSNISDAVRWVLGEQSARVLRGGKMEDVIFSGTEKRKPMPYCEVSLVFDNEDQSLRSTYTEVMVTRRVYRSGESEYYLNRNACRLKDINELFLDTGIGLEGYSLIGQGHIDDILSTRSEDRRVVFEEAAGISTFRMRKEEAERKLRRTQENLGRLNDLLEEIALRLPSLQVQSQQAQEYLVLAGSLKDLEVNSFLVRHDRLKQRISSLKALSEEIKLSLEHEEAEINGSAALREELSEEITKIEGVLSSERENQSELNHALLEARAQYERCQAMIGQSEQEAQHLRENAQNCFNNLSELEALMSNNNMDSGKREREYEEAEAHFRQEEQKLQSLIDRESQTESVLNLKREKLLEAINKKGDARALEARRQAMLNQMEARMAELQKNESDLLVQREEYIAHHERTLLDREQTDGSLEELKLKLHKYQEEIVAFEREEADLIRKAQEQSAQLKAEEAKYHLLLDLSRDYDGYFTAVKKALEHAKGNPRVFGAVAQLLQVPKEYETAVDMILGNALQNVVTKDEESAKELIEYLRSNRLGRTTFLPLSAIKGRTLTRDEERCLSMPGCLGLASDLITCAPEYKEVLVHLLGRTLFASDLEHAIPISRAGRQAFHVVTLQGDVMRAGGAMTGGSVAGKQTSLIGREREIKELKFAMTGLEKSIQNLQQKFEGREEQGREIKQKLRLIEEELRQEEIASARDQAREENAKKELEAQNAQLKHIQVAVEQLLESIDETRRDLQESAQSLDDSALSTDQMQAELEELQKNLQTDKLNTEKSRIILQSNQAKCQELKHAVDIQGRDRSRWQKEIDQQKTLEAQIRDKQRDLELKKTEEQANLILSEKKSVALQQQIEQLEARLTIIETERRDLNAKLNAEIKKGENAFRTQNELSQKLHRNEMVCARTEDELQSLSDYIWNSYEMSYALCEEFRKEAFNMSEAEREIAALKQRIKEMGTINLLSVEEYAQEKTRYDDLDRQRNDAEKAREDLEQLIKRLLGSMEKQFIEELAKLDALFGESFKRLFRGGQAKIQLADPNLPLECDIQINVQPPGKKLQLLSLLSGGERTLTAIALLFAMLKLKPTSFCIMDEIEAALDDANIDYFAEYLEEYAASTQFIVVTHRKGTMRRCDSLYGVTMQEKGVSNILSVSLQDYAN